MNRLKRYENYKDSGVEWLGEIPEHWESQKMKYLGKMFAGLTDKKGDDFAKEISEDKMPFIPFTNVCNNLKIDKNQMQYVKIKPYEKQNKVQKNDIIFLMSSETLDDIGKCSIHLDEEQFYLNSFCKGFRPKTFAVNAEFLNYLLQSKTYRNYFALVGRGFTRINIKQEYINDLFTVLPLKEEQTKIASFLDKKVAQIDEVISQKEKLIELLKERKQIVINDVVTKGLDKDVEFVDSGVEWIGKIPKHWTKVKLKWISKIYAGGTPDKNNLRFWENGTIPWIASGEVNQEIVTKPTTNITEKGFKNSSARWIPKDSLIVALAGQGKTKGMVAYLAIDTTGNQSLSAVIPNKKKISSKYLYNFIKSAYKELRGSAGEGQRDGLNLEKLGVLDVVFPPKDEQIKIVEYIENQTTKIDIAIELEQNYISKLKEYKASLIDSVVTGKVKVS
ncbi:restriction endonuclease subunit S [Aliarcobacter cryaerophilus]|uniref:restriction endonuclease subunit S n=1 Tax=Aliarcobacter cryaerophilus TaxID=28198 RepID=UPI0021B61A44|nr:restriction endonuclease subunit S [Aliarcobacter cryaerophilus]MCT7485376.1 restriction endonuclease subunit S [Aliarcobacter cryaerophilus]MCT7491305.1 restriction endonuclease subunit S [Aliarcobacter cryaerophilus]